MIELDKRPTKPGIKHYVARLLNAGGADEPGRGVCLGASEKLLSTCKGEFRYYQNKIIQYNNVEVDHLNIIPHCIGLS